MSYKTDVPFDQLVRDSLFVMVDSLQNQWINVIRANQPTDTTNTDTTIGDTANLDQELLKHRPG